VANYVPAAAVIRRPRALSGFIGRKGCVGGWVRLLLNLAAQRWGCRGYGPARGCERLAERTV